MKKIAIITPDYPPASIGGCAASAHLLAEELRKRGYVTDVFIGAQSKSRVAEHEGGCDYYIRGIPKIDVVNAWMLRRFLRKKIGRYDVIVVYNLGPLMGVVPLKKQVRGPIVAVLNNLGGVTPNPIAQFRTGEQKDISALRALWLSLGYRDVKMWPLGALLHWLTFLAIRRALRGVDAYVALTPSIQRLYEKTGLPRGKFRVIPNMADPAFQRDGKPENPEKIHLAFVGQLSPKKGALDLLRAFLGLPAGLRQKSRLSIIGRGKEERALKTLAKGADADITIQSMPHEDLPAFLGTVDVLVHPAKWFEPFSRIWLEAMASGCAILSSKNPSAEDVLGGVALFFDVLDFKDFRAALKRVMADAKLRRELQAKSRNAVKRFSPAAVVAEWEKYLLTLSF